MPKLEFATTVERISFPHCNIIGQIKTIWKKKKEKEKRSKEKKKKGPKKERGKPATGRACLAVFPPLANVL